MNGTMAQRHNGTTAQINPEVKVKVEVEVEYEKPTYLTSILFAPFFTPVSLKTSIVK